MNRVLQIRDLNNWKSIKYAEKSLETFAPVSDLIEIETYQCYVPDTLPSFKWNENKKRTLTEKSILYTYYELMTRIADGEKFIIMEHDAYLNPDRIDIFRKWFSDSNLDRFSIWNVGIAIEFHTLSKEIAQTFLKIMESDHTESAKGPMSIIAKSHNRINAGKILFPVAGGVNLMCVAENTRNADKGIGEIYNSPVTQMVDRKIGVTIEHPNWSPDVNIHFIDL